MVHSIRFSSCFRQFWFQLSLVILTNSLATGSLAAQTIELAQVPGLPPTPPPQDVIPPTEPTPPEAPKPTPLPPPEQLLEPLPTPATPQPIPGKIPDQITVKRFEVVGSTVFSPEQLNQVLAPFSNRQISFAELFQARSAVTQLYIDRGYITSGALIPPQTIQDGVVTIQVVEGGLEAIEVTGTKRLNSNYVRDRLPQSKPLNQQRLLEALQLLQLNPLIQNLSAELTAGSRQGTSILEVQVTEAETFSTQIGADNGRSPSVGSFRRRVQLSEANLLGLGDGLSLAYSNTAGSNALDASYALPINSRNGTVSLNLGISDSSVIEPDFEVLGIDGESRYYELTLRQPLVQTPTQEFALGLTASRRESDIASSLFEDLDISPALLSPGADEEGRTRISVLQFFQEWTQRNSREVIAARSQFNFGVGALNATINDEGIPDSRFFSWRGQAQWVRLLAPETLLLIRTDAQLTPSLLVPLEQFGLGGLDTVRGYRQDTLLTDNGVFASAELRLPILRSPRRTWVLQVTPFVDFGTTWDNPRRDEANVDISNTDTLASVGLGLRYQLGDRLTARVDWGIPLINLSENNRDQDESLQEDGLYFSVNYNPF